MSTGTVPVKSARMVVVRPAQMVASPLTVATAATGVLTVKMAAVVVAVPQEFVKAARYRDPFWLAAAVKLRVVAVAPGMSVKVPPPSVLSCHCTVGAGRPLAADVNVAVLPAHAVWGVGWAVTDGGTFTVRVAAVVVAGPQVFVNTARYCLPLSAPTAVKLSVVDVAPGMSVKLTPPLMLTCHCTVGVGVPLAADVKVAVWPAFTVRFVG